MKLSAIVPATDHPSTLDRCLAAIRSADEPPEEVVVVEQAPRPGPAAARNEGARRAAGDVLVFVDADVISHPDAFRRVRRAFENDPTLDGVFGAYDDEPEARTVVSVFRNLLHHHVHSTSPGLAQTFWAGLGALRREVFVAARGFDAERFPQPSIEDIELGMRLTRAGARIVLDPSVRGTHLKRWTLTSMISTDLLARGAPWVEALLVQGTAPASLNLGWRHRLSVVASLLAAYNLCRGRPVRAAGSLAALAALNQPFYALLLRKGGVRLAGAGVALHAVHHVVGAAAIPLGAARFLRRR